MPKSRKAKADTAGSGRLAFFAGAAFSIIAIALAIMITVSSIHIPAPPTTTYSNHPNQVLSSPSGLPRIAVMNLAERSYLPQLLPDLKGIGVTWDRIDVGDGSNIGQIQTALSEGVRPLVLYAPGSNDGGCPSSPAVTASQVKALAQKILPLGLHEIELCNEPYWNGESPQAYADQYDATHKALQGMGITLIAYEQVPQWGGPNWMPNFLNEIAADNGGEPVATAAKEVDAWSVHAYGTMAQWASAMNFTHAQALSYGSDVPWYVTEVGQCATTGSVCKSAVGYSQQASDMTQYLNDLIEKTGDQGTPYSWVVYWDWYEATDDGTGGWGLFNQSGTNCPCSIAERPVFFALKAWMQAHPGADNGSTSTASSTVGTTSSTTLGPQNTPPALSLSGHKISWSSQAAAAWYKGAISNGPRNDTSRVTTFVNLSLNTSWTPLASPGNTLYYGVASEGPAGEQWSATEEAIAWPLTSSTSTTTVATTVPTVSTSSTTSSTTKTTTSTTTVGASTSSTTVPQGQNVPPVLTVNGNVISWSPQASAKWYKGAASNGPRGNTGRTTAYTNLSLATTWSPAPSPGNTIYYGVASEGPSGEQWTANEVSITWPLPSSTTSSTTKTTTSTTTAPAQNVPPALSYNGSAISWSPQAGAAWYKGAISNGPRNDTARTSAFVNLSTATSWKPLASPGNTLYYGVASEGPSGEKWSTAEIAIAWPLQTPSSSSTTMPTTASTASTTTAVPTNTIASSSTTTATPGASSTTTTGPATTSVTSATTTIPVGGGSGGSGGGPGGGGTQKPTVRNITGGYRIYNFTQYEYVDVSTTSKQKIRITQNYITPTSAGVSLNSESVAMSPNTIVYIGNFSGAKYYAKLVNISYLPIEDTVTMDVFTNASAVNVSTPSVYTYNFSGAQGFFNANISRHTAYDLNLSSLKMQLIVSSMENASTPLSFFFRPSTISVPKQYTALLLTNISFTSANPINLSATFDYRCGTAGVAPYVLKQNSWSPIANYTNNPGSCTLSFILSGDPILAIFASNTTISTATVQHTTASTAPSTTTIMQQTAQYPYTYVAIAIIAIIVITALVYYLRKRGKGSDVPVQPSSQAPPEAGNKY
ncbi:MAG: hypothetical protein KGH72_05490 [Candidatus Micrarchaeota archaeon]|nr:hypothetical protein [Candidatus Micrarchaeota archaeon]